MHTIQIEGIRAQGRRRRPGGGVRKEATWIIWLTARADTRWGATLLPDAPDTGARARVHAGRRSTRRSTPCRSSSGSSPRRVVIRSHRPHRTRTTAGCRVSRRWTRSSAPSAPAAKNAGASRTPKARRPESSGTAAASHRAHRKPKRSSGSAASCTAAHPARSAPQLRRSAVTRGAARRARSGPRAHCVNGVGRNGCAS